jgi:calcium binding protein 39
MAFFFNRGRSRQPADVVRATKELLLRVQEEPSNPKVWKPCAFKLARDTR